MSKKKKKKKIVRTRTGTVKQVRRKTTKRQSTVRPTQYGVEYSNITVDKTTEYISRLEYCTVLWEGVTALQPSTSTVVNIVYCAL